MKSTFFWRHLLAVLSLLLLVLAGGCEKRAAEVTEIKVSFEWNPKGMPLTANPEIRMEGVPATTHHFLVELIDLDLKNFNHGGGTYPYTGTPVIPAGKLKGYYLGPHPPVGVVHQYRFTVKAMDVNERVIGVGRQTRAFPETDQ